MLLRMGGKEEVSKMASVIAVDLPWPSTDDLNAEIPYFAYLFCCCQLVRVVMRNLDRYPTFIRIYKWPSLVAGETGPM